MRIKERKTKQLYDLSKGYNPFAIRQRDIARDEELYREYEQGEKDNEYIQEKQMSLL